ncbi:MAG: hypothetical protein JNN05_09435 [Candidatus Omnitrophica bacterium]|nr:hypothetical protein [Candidatus Omnitrophota bacterium]
MRDANLKVMGILLTGFFVGQNPCGVLANERPEITGQMESRYIWETDVDAQSGQISVSETKASVGYDSKFENGMPISFSISGRHTDIKSDVPVFLPSHLAALSFSAGVKIPAPFTASQNYFLGLDIMPSMYSDGWDNFSSDTFRIPIRSYLIYRRDENFIVFAGASIRPDFDTKILPLLGIIYRPNQYWEINMASDNPQIIYHASEKTKLILEADIINDEYELTGSGNKGRVLFYRELSAGLGIQHQFTKNVSGLVSAGSVFKRMLRYEDDNGKVMPDQGLYVKARVQFNF